VQAAGFFMLLFDPLTKALMARFGGPQAAGYFEMANQAVVKVRALIIVANQAIVPKVAHIAETAPLRLLGLYRENLRVLAFVALPMFTLLYVWGGLASLLMVGARNAQFLLFFEWSVVGWALNTFAGPAYFTNLGTGRVAWNTLSHAVMGAINAGLGWFLGTRFGPAGVIGAYIAALVTGSWLLVVAFQLRSGIPIRHLALGEQVPLAIVCFALIAGAHLAPAMARQSETGVLLVTAAAPLLLAIPVWRHPLRKALWKRYRAPDFLGQ
jgi:O-antigen/teichoic acid export membrane protein